VATPIPNEQKKLAAVLQGYAHKLMKICSIVVFCSEDLVMNKSPDGFISLNSQQIQFSVRNWVAHECQ